MMDGGSIIMDVGSGSVDVHDSHGSMDVDVVREYLGSMEWQNFLKGEDATYQELKDRSGHPVGPYDNAWSWFQERFPRSRPRPRWWSAR